MRDILKTLTYTTIILITLNFDAHITPGYNGNNDIACAGLSPTFIKNGASTLTANTDNRFWRGQTSVEDGTMLVGGTADYTAAVWGDSGGQSGILRLEVARLLAVLAPFMAMRRPLKMMRPLLLV